MLKYCLVYCSCRSDNVRLWYCIATAHDIYFSFPSADKQARKHGRQSRRQCTDHTSQVPCSAGTVTVTEQDPHALANVLMPVKESQTDSGFLVVSAVQLSFNVLIDFLDVVTGSCPPQLALQTNRLHSSPNLPYLKCSCLYAILLWVWPSNTNMWELVAVNCCPQLCLVAVLEHFFQIYDSWCMLASIR